MELRQTSLVPGVRSFINSIDCGDWRRSPGMPMIDMRPSEPGYYLHNMEIRSRQGGIQSRDGGRNLQKQGIADCR